MANLKKKKKKVKAKGLFASEHFSRKPKKGKGTLQFSKKKIKSFTRAFSTAKYKKAK